MEDTLVIGVMLVHLTACKAVMLNLEEEAEEERDIAKEIAVEYGLQIVRQMVAQFGLNAEKLEEVSEVNAPRIAEALKLKKLFDNSYDEWELEGKEEL